MTPLDPTSRLYEHLQDYNDGNLSGEELVIDVLATVRHFCDTYAVEYADADRIAHDHYLAERQPQRFYYVPDASEGSKAGANLADHFDATRER